MKHLFRKVSASRANIVSHIKIGSRAVSILDREGDLRGAIDGHEFMRYLPKSSTEEQAIVLADVVSEIASKEPGAKIIVMKGKDPLPLIESLLKGIKGTGVVVRRMPSDQTDIRKDLSRDTDIEDSADREKLSHNICVLANRMSKAVGEISVLKNDAAMMTRGKLVRDMWGADKMQKVFDGIKNKLAYDDPMYEKASF